VKFQRPVVVKSFVVVVVFTVVQQPKLVLGLLALRFLGHTLFTRTHAIGMTPLDEGSACRRDLYLATHNIHKRQTSMTPGGFEPAIPTGERPQIHASDRTVIAIGSSRVENVK
jgi:hypothetical protein